MTCTATLERTSFMPRPARSSKPLAVWLLTHRTARGLTVRALADKAGVSHPRITQIEGGGSAARDMVERLSAALSGPNADEHTGRALLNAGLKAAGFAPVDNTGHDEHEAIDYVRGLPETKQDKALRALKAIFDEDDAADNAGNIGREAK